MEEFKTLKDLECDEHWCNPSGMPNIKAEKGKHLVVSEDLRQEAIKWIKELKNKLYCKNCSGYQKKFVFYEKHPPIGSCMHTDIIDLSPTIEWIKQFFNISDKELKEAD